MTNEPLLADFDPADLQALGPQARVEAEQIFARAGFSLDSIKAKLGTSSPAPHSGNAPGRSVTTPVSALHADNGLTFDQKVAGYKNLLRFSSDPDAVRASAKADGVNLGELDAAAQSRAQREAEERNTVIERLLSAPVSPADYRLQYQPERAQPPDIAELHALDRSVRAAFHAAAVPSILAQSLLDALTQTAKSYADMKSEARALRFAEEGARVRNLSGDLVENARLAEAAYHRLPENFRKLMDEQHAFHSAASQAALANIGRAIEERERRKVHGI